MNKQREIIYGQRRQTLEGASLKEDILGIIQKVIDEIVNLFLGANQEINLAGLAAEVKLKFGLNFEISQLKDLNNEQVKERLYQAAISSYEEKEKAIGTGMMRHMEQMVFLQIIDTKWKDHLYAMDSLREGIGLRAYGQRDPLVEYKREAFEMFSQMIASIEEEAVETLFKLQAAKPERFKGVFSSVSQELLHPEAAKFERPLQEEAAPEGKSASALPSFKHKPIQSTHLKVGRNDPCPCGAKDPVTGAPIKFKKCCGR